MHYAMVVVRGHEGAVNVAANLRKKPRKPAFCAVRLLAILNGPSTRHLDIAVNCVRPLGHGAAGNGEWLLLSAVSAAIDLLAGGRRATHIVNMILTGFPTSEVTLFGDFELSGHV